MNACRPEKQTQQDDVHYTANNNGLIHGINDIIMNIIMFRVPNSQSADGGEKDRYFHLKIYQKLHLNLSTLKVLSEVTEVKRGMERTTEREKVSSQEVCKFGR